MGAKQLRARPRTLSTRHLLVWISRLYLHPTTPQRHTLACSEHSPFISQSKSISWQSRKMLYYFIYYFFVFVRRLAASFRAFGSVCGHANRTETPNMRAQFSIGSNTTAITNVAKWMPSTASNSSDSDMHSINYYMVNWRRNECRADVRKLCFDWRRVRRTLHCTWTNNNNNGNLIQIFKYKFCGTDTTRHRGQILNLSKWIHIVQEKNTTKNQRSLWHVACVDQKYLHNIKPILSAHKQTCRWWH